VEGECHVGEYYRAPVFFLLFTGAAKENFSHRRSVQQLKINPSHSAFLHSACIQQSPAAIAGRARRSLHPAD